jgi:hypothetical protein
LRRTTLNISFIVLFIPLLLTGFSSNIDKLKDRCIDLGNKIADKIAKETIKGTSEP